MPSSVVRFRESLTLVLIALLPLHAMAVTVLTHAVQGAGHGPLRWIAIWKELVLAIILLLAVIEILRSRDASSDRRVWSLDVLDWCILGAVAAGAWASYGLDGGNGPLFELSREDRRFLFGFKYDFLPVLSFFLLRRVSWSSEFRRWASWVLLGTGFLVSVFGLLTLYAPMPFFTALGYSDLHSLYRPDAPLAAFQMVEGTDLRRIQSVMSGPNQFGLWLLLPLAAAFQWIAVSVRARNWFRMCCGVFTLGVIITALAFTYSRSAWIGAAVMTALMLLLLLRHTVSSVLHRSMVISVAGVLCGIVLVVGLQKAPEVLLRTQSLIGHLTKPLQALQIMREHPLGKGLGTAGPASNRFSDTCLFFDLGADISWAKKRTDICVFVGGVRRIPAGKVCECPLLTENWYLQWGVEMGYIGLLLSLLIVILPLAMARRLPALSLRTIPVLALAGIGTAGLFLHSFEDAAVALTVWILLASAMLGVPEPVFGDDGASGTLHA